MLALQGWCEGFHIWAPWFIWESFHHRLLLASSVFLLCYFNGMTVWPFIALHQGKNSAAFCCTDQIKLPLNKEYLTDNTGLTMRRWTKSLFHCWSNNAVFVVSRRGCAAATRMVKYSDCYYSAHRHTFTERVRHCFYAAALGGCSIGSDLTKGV